MGEYWHSCDACGYRSQDPEDVEFHHCEGRGVEVRNYRSKPKSSSVMKAGVYYIDGNGEASPYRPNNGGNNRNYNNNGGNNNRNYRGNGGQRKKHTGCKFKHDKRGQPCLVAWNYSKEAGMMSILCTPYGKTKTVTAASGKVWENWMAKVRTKAGGERIEGCMYCVTTGKAQIEGLGFVLNPHAANGGYCGTFKK